MNSANGKSQRRFSGWQIALLMLLLVLASIALTLWAASVWLFPSALPGAQLSASETVALEQKLAVLGLQSGAAESDAEWLRPAPYEETAGSRRLVFSERELNALIARDPQLSGRVAVSLRDELASVRLLIPVDPDFPVLGGRTLRVSAGAELSYAAGRPLVLLRGVSVMGVPVPGAWLGNLKNVDLVERFGASPGFWQQFAAGVAAIRIEDGALLVELAE